ncbi:unnamed protein product [Phytophthora lilii]|uniref:Unnamed protein product n=1 Tax=Phytophthora lilii TaxID=2077276 RepID=A0A9W6WR25_9STRA|nr:unnamed protein product [Phytophthora lilii]
MAYCNRLLLSDLTEGFQFLVIIPTPGLRRFVWYSVKSTGVVGDLVQMNASLLDEVAGFFADSSLPMLPDVPDLEDASTNKSFSPVSSTSDSIDTEVVETNAKDLRPGLRSRVRSKSKDAQRRSMYRAREKKLREDLRRQVNALSVKLELLQKRKASGVFENEGRSSVPLSMWKALSIQQKGARLEAEAEYHRLRAAVEVRCAMITDLKDFVRRRVTEARLAQEIFTCTTTTFTAKRARLTSSDAVLYDAFSQQLDGLYAQTDKIMRDSSMDSITDGAMMFRPTRKTQHNVEFFEYAFKQTTPLELSQARCALWQVAHMLHRQEGREVYKSPGYSDDPNTIALKFHIGSHPASSITLSEHIIIRRYDEEDRTVLVWRSLTEGAKSLTGMHSDKTGWCILRSFELGTIKETYVRQVPIHFSRTHTKEDISKFTILIHRSSEEDGIAIAQGLAATTRTV